MDLGKFEKISKEKATLKFAIPGAGLVVLEARPADGETNSEKPSWRLYFEGLECGALWRKHKSTAKKPYYTGSTIFVGFPAGLRFFIFSDGDGEAGKIVLYRPNKGGANDSDF